MRNLEPHEGGSGSLLEIVDMMCSAVEAMAGVVRKQAILIEQAEIAEQSSTMIFQKHVNN